MLNKDYLQEVINFGLVNSFNEKVHAKYGEDMTKLNEELDKFIQTRPQLGNMSFAEKLKLFKAAMGSEFEAIANGPNMIKAMEKWEEDEVRISIKKLESLTASLVPEATLQEIQAVINLVIEAS